MASSRHSVARSEPPAPGVCSCGAQVEPIWAGGTIGWLVGDECELCGRRRVQVEEARLKARARYSRLAQANLPPDADPWDFATAEAEAGALKVGEDLRAWQKVHYACRTWPSSSRKGFYIQGPTGTGKTVLAYCLVKAAMEDGKSAAFVSVSELLQEIRKGFARDSRARDMAGLAERVGVLVLDEIGAERPSDLLRGHLLRIINHRISNRRPTHYTTNCNPDELQRQLGDKFGRILSRIIGSTNGLSLAGGDYRTLGGEEQWLYEGV